MSLDVLSNVIEIGFSYFSNVRNEDVSEWHLTPHSKHRETVFEWILIRLWFWPIRGPDFRIDSKRVHRMNRKIKFYFSLLEKRVAT